MEARPLPASLSFRVAFCLIKHATIVVELKTRSGSHVAAASSRANEPAGDGRMPYLLRNQTTCADDSRFGLLRPVGAKCSCPTCGRKRLPALPPRSTADPATTSRRPRRSPASPAEETGSMRSVFLARWGLVPSWADDLAVGNRMINARGETVDSKPSFKRRVRFAAMFDSRRRLLRMDEDRGWQAALPH